MYELRAGTEEAVSFELEACEWRKLDVEEPGAARVLWMRGQRVRQCAVTVSSLRAHVSLRSEVAGARGAKASMLPDSDSRRMRRELEGVEIFGMG